MVVINRYYPRVKILHVVYSEGEEEYTSCSQCIFNVNKKCTGSDWEELRGGKTMSLVCNSIYKHFRFDKRYKNQTL